MNHLSSSQQFDEFVRGRYPLVFAVSHEESRVLVQFEGVCGPLERSLVLWSITKGIQTMYRAPGAAEHGMKECAPREALGYFEKIKDDAVVVMLDPHPYLEKDPTIVRALRDCVEAFREGKAKRTLVMLSPVLRVPPEVEESAAVIDWQLPDRDDFLQLIGNAAREAGIADVPPEAVDALVGLTEMRGGNSIARALVRVGKLDPVVIQEEKEQVIRTSGQLEFIRTSESLDTVGGLEILKTWLMRRRGAFSEEARAFRLPRPRGILIVGPPGVGKSLLAKAVGTAWRLPLLRLDIGSLFGSLLGSSEDNARKALKVVSAMAPCCLWLEEIEKSFSGTASSGMTDGGVGQRVFGTFLTWMQENDKEVFIVATANDVTQLPPEFLRKGRFDEIFAVDLPTARERGSIFRIHLRKVGRDPDALLSIEQLDELIEATDGYSGSEIEQIVATALYPAFERGCEPTFGDLLEAATLVTPLSKTAESKVEAIREWAKGKTQPASAPEGRPAVGGRFR